MTITKGEWQRDSNMKDESVSKMELWTAEAPNGWKISIMLEELIEAGVSLTEFDVKAVDLFSGERFLRLLILIRKFPH